MQPAQANLFSEQTPFFTQGEEAEEPNFLRRHLINYIGNKRSLLNLISEGLEYAKQNLRKQKISFLDLFAGSGVVSRMAKSHASRLVVNDLELYSRVFNECYLANHTSVPHLEVEEALKQLRVHIDENRGSGFITELYSPRDEGNIQRDDRVFYTRRNAQYIDTACRWLQNADYRISRYIYGPLISQASIHVNTSGVFKGFYKNEDRIGQFGGAGRNALTRILKNIEVCTPILSRFECDVEICQKDSNELVREIDPVDVAYFDPPYNQHPYGSNYFMLNLICNYQRPANISRISGIPADWNRSLYNKQKHAASALFDAVQNCKAKFILISYNSEGFISHGRFLRELEKVGPTSVLDTVYNTFRGCRNLRNRDAYLTEFLYLVDKR